MSSSELSLRIALGLTPALPYSIFESVAAGSLQLDDFFSADEQELFDLTGVRVPLDVRRLALEQGQNESEFVERHNIRVFLCTDDGYPRHLRAQKDAPQILFALGHADLNPAHAVSFVGTRRATSYGVEFTRAAIRHLNSKLPGTTIVSGLAFGIDSAAHAASLTVEAPTIAIVAHGLHTIYPSAHRSLAQEIVREGGAIVTEYPSGTQPFPGHFLQRNRIIAGMSDLTVVVESDVRGGAMSTARHARLFGRKVAALPGRFSDKYSSGCNLLIAEQKAECISSFDTITDLLSGTPASARQHASQPTLTPQLPENQQRIYDIVKRHNAPIDIETIAEILDINFCDILPEISDMEVAGVLVRHPGERYSTPF